MYTTQNFNASATKPARSTHFCISVFQLHPLIPSVSGMVPSNQLFFSSQLGFHRTKLLTYPIIFLFDLLMIFFVPRTFWPLCVNLVVALTPVQGCYNGMRARVRRTFGRSKKFAEGKFCIDCRCCLWLWFCKGGPKTKFRQSGASQPTKKIMQNNRSNCPGRLSRDTMKGMNFTKMSWICIVQSLGDFVFAVIERRPAHVCTIHDNSSQQSKDNNNEHEDEDETSTSPTEQMSTGKK